MELIPILSLIILVATISTFILAVGAYILYKIREGKAKATLAQPSTVQAELVSPVPIMAEQTISRTTGRSTYTRDRYPTRETYREPRYAPTSEGSPEMRPTYVGAQQGQSNADSARYQSERGLSSTEHEREAASRKFTRYTTAERMYEPPRTETKKEDKEGLKWR